MTGVDDGDACSGGDQRQHGCLIGSLVNNSGTDVVLSEFCHQCHPDIMGARIELTDALRDDSLPAGHFDVTESQNTHFPAPNELDVACYLRNICEHAPSDFLERAAGGRHADTAWQAIEESN